MLLSKVALALGIEDPEFVSNLQAHLQDVYEAGAQYVLAKLLHIPSSHDPTVKTYPIDGPLADHFIWRKNLFLTLYPSEWRMAMRWKHRSAIIKEGLREFLRAHLYMKEMKYSNGGEHTFENFRSLGFTEKEARRLLTTRLRSRHCHVLSEWAYDMVNGHIDTSPDIEDFIKQAQFSDLKLSEKSIRHDWSSINITCFGLVNDTYK